MKLYFVRHGQTNHNKNNVIQGQDEGSMNSAGIKQVKKTTKRLQYMDFDRIISSDVPRCKSSAEMINKALKKEISYSQLLREKDNGDIVGIPAKDVDWDSFKGTFETKKAPNGENLLEVRERGRQFIENIKKQYTDENILVVSHAGFMKILFGDLLGMTIQDSIFKLYLENASLSMFEFGNHLREGHTSRFINDTSHLVSSFYLCSKTVDKK